MSGIEGPGGVGGVGGIDPYGAGAGGGAQPKSRQGILDQMAKADKQGAYERHETIHDYCDFIQNHPDDFTPNEVTLARNIDNETAQTKDINALKTSISNNPRPNEGDIPSSRGHVLDSIKAIEVLYKSPNPLDWAKIPGAVRDLSNYMGNYSADFHSNEQGVANNPFSANAKSLANLYHLIISQHIP